MDNTANDTFDFPFTFSSIEDAEKSIGNQIYKYALIVTRSGYKWDDDGVEWAMDELMPCLDENECLVTMNGELPNTAKKLAGFIESNPNSFIVFSANPVELYDLSGTPQDSIDIMIKLLKEAGNDLSWYVLADLFGIDPDTGEPTPERIAADNAKAEAEAADTEEPKTENE